MARVWVAVRRFGAKYPVWAGVAAVAGVALLAGGGYAVAQVAGSSGASNATGVSPSVEATSSGGPTDDTTRRPDVSVSPSQSPSPSASLVAANGPTRVLIGAEENGFLHGSEVSGDGSRLAWAIDLFGAPAPGKANARAFAVDSRTLTSVELNLPAPFGANPVNLEGISPDGRYVVLSPPPAICSATTGECAGTSEPGIYYWDVEWSPDSSRFAATKVTGQPPNRVVVVDASTHSERVLADGEGATWSHDGTRIAWVSGESGTQNVWTQVVDGGTAATLLPDDVPPPGSEPTHRIKIALAWSHDDSQLAIAYSTASGAEVDIVAADGSRTQPVTGLSRLARTDGVGRLTFIRDLGWSADDSYVAFTGVYYASDGVRADATYPYVVSSTSLAATELSAEAVTGAADWSVQWSPFGHLLGAMARTRAQSHSYGETYPWLSWSGAGSALTPVDPRCGASELPHFVPDAGGGAPTQAFGRISCSGDPPGVYLVDLGT